MFIVEFSCLFCNTKISKFFDMTKFWAARLYRLPEQVIGFAAWLVQELFVAQVLKKFKL